MNRLNRLSRMSWLNRMRRRSREWVAAALLLVTLLVAGCGVGSEDEPQPIEDTPIPHAPAIPSVSTEPVPTTPSSPAPTTTTTRVQVP